MPPKKRARIPPDVARVVADHEDLGKAARKALHVSEKVARKDVERAAKAGAALKKRSSGQKR